MVYIELGLIHFCMKQIHISFTQEQEQKLKAESKKTGNPIAAIVRIAVHKHLEEAS